MTDKLKTDYALGVLLVFVAARGGNWLITPMSHPAATSLDYALTWLEIGVCLIAGLRLISRANLPVSVS